MPGKAHNSIYVGPTLDPCGQFIKFKINITQDQIRTGYWRFDTEGHSKDDHRAYLSGFMSPEAVIETAARGQGASPNISLRWIPGEEDLYKVVRVGTASEHLRCIAEERQQVGLRAPPHGEVPSYLLDSTGKLWNFRIRSNALTRSEGTLSSRCRSVSDRINQPWSITTTENNAKGSQQSAPSLSAANASSSNTNISQKHENSKLKMPHQQSANNSGYNTNNSCHLSGPNRQFPSYTPPSSNTLEKPTSTPISSPAPSTLESITSKSGHRQEPKPSTHSSALQIPQSGMGLSLSVPGYYTNDKPPPNPNNTNAEPQTAHISRSPYRNILPHQSSEDSGTQPEISNRSAAQTPSLEALNSSYRSILPRMPPGEVMPSSKAHGYAAHTTGASDLQDRTRQSVESSRNHPTLKRMHEYASGWENLKAQPMNSKQSQPLTTADRALSQHRFNDRSMFPAIDPTLYNMNVPHTPGSSINLPSQPNPGANIPRGVQSKPIPAPKMYPDKTKLLRRRTPIFSRPALGDRPVQKPSESESEITESPPVVRAPKLASKVPPLVPPKALPSSSSQQSRQHQRPVTEKSRSSIKSPPDYHNLEESTVIVDCPGSEHDQTSYEDLDGFVSVESPNLPKRSTNYNDANALWHMYYL
ncbi:unnamed protein product [Periconia digitata]|uniref:Uncharacterized protein n=1 Tax=Periconia digitata TaxID=1303443 RepID=A0A9W4UCB8_9PLEO|nr:unnamed protein product [Periconia digitata]